MKSIKRMSLGAVALLTLLVGAGLLGNNSATAATIGISATGGDVFSPASVTATEGDTVAATITGSFHDFDSSVVPAGGTAWNTAPAGAGTLSSTVLVAGTYTFFCDVHANASDATLGNIDANIAAGLMVGKIVVSAAVVDTTGPVTSAVAASPNPTNGAAAVTVTANVNDTTTGNSNVAGAEYSTGVGAAAAGSGTAMVADDGSFNSPTEVARANVSTAALAPGDTLTVWVRGRDAAGNWGSAVSVAVGVTAVPAGAETASVTVLAGGLSNVTSPVDLGAIQLTGSDQEVAANPAPWTATDARGSGDGWNVTITSSDFSSAGGSIAVANFKVALPTAGITTVSGNAAPVSGAVTAVALDNTTPLKLLSAAAGTGMGTYDYVPDFVLTVPASAAPGSYEASMVVSINSGP